MVLKWFRRRNRHGTDISLRAETREEFPLLLNDLNLRGEGAEVGVQLGGFSEHILEQWDGSVLYSIDPWREAGSEYVDVANRAQDEHDDFYRATVQRLSRFGKRSQIIRATSVEAAARFALGSLDFVYIDARHDEPWISEDIRVWWPIVRSGGVLAGHDYIDGDLAAGRFRVRSAVQAFALEHSLDVTSTSEEWPSWIIRRP